MVAHTLVEPELLFLSLLLFLPLFPHDILKEIPEWLLNYVIPYLFLNVLAHKQTLVQSKLVLLPQGI